MSKPIILLGSAGSGKTRYAEAIAEKHEISTRIHVGTFGRKPTKFWADFGCIVVEEATPEEAKSIYSRLERYGTQLVFPMQDIDITTGNRRFNIVNL